MREQKAPLNLNWKKIRTRLQKAKEALAQLADHQGQQQQTRAAPTVEVDDSHDANLEDTGQQQPPHSATAAEDNCDSDYVAFLTKVFDPL